MMKYLKAVVALIAVVALAGCAMQPLSYHRYAYTENLRTQALAEGTVIRCQSIRIRNVGGQSANSFAGGLGGAAVGFAISSTPIAAIAGALGGAILGHALTPDAHKGTEVMVKLDDGQLLGVPEVGNPHLVAGEQVAILRGEHGRTRAVPLH
ncbi:hypothetical protein HER14_06535 [Acidithiobacillus thiooxidans]|uniref:hypothetical protein n=1 Tax=Acidithiobacillus thiooxidans TaxID=930 RepID=UPI001C0650D1|nr:hypothetical protein [Acidithiobacillus thiooxidans]MBU2750607.1 hypothetical protein [Acidithiobacillus thiooxidans]MBU2836233.1 hypothetical protein [Acidithiobacillus thiooxidans]